MPNPENFSSPSDAAKPSVLTWRDEMHAQLNHGKHVLLYGNVEDRYLLEETKPRTVLLAQCLNHYFLTQNYQLIVHYDLADGMRTAIPERMDPILLEILDGASCETPDLSRQTASQSASQTASQSASQSAPQSASQSAAQTPDLRIPDSPEAQTGSFPISDRAAQMAAEFELASQKRRDAMRSSLFTRHPKPENSAASRFDSPRSEAESTESPAKNAFPGTVTPAETLTSTGTPNSGNFLPGTSLPGASNAGTGTPEAVSVPVSLASRSRSAEDVIPQLRRVLAQEEVSAAVVIHFSDKLFDDTRRQSRSEREYLLHLKKTLIEAATVHQGKLTGRRNALILVASKLASVPTWLYQEHPLLALVRIPAPIDEERRRFMEGFLGVFTRNAPLTESRKSDYLQTFVDQTQGLALWDLMALGALANRSTEDPIDEPSELRKLISLYRYGQREDPWEKFNSGDRRDRIQDARENIEKRVKGQPEAVNAIVEMLVSATVGITFSPATRQTGKPKGVFFFVGPTGVGKTELAKALAELIFGDEARLRRFDMSEFSESHAAEKLTGSPPGYVGYEEGGQLTNFVRENPFSLLLFDEIEKAHGQVMDKFLQILEDGRLTDSKGQTAFFSQSVIIFTSNIGADSLFSDAQASEEKRVSDTDPDYEAFVKKHFTEKVREHFVHVLKRPEILNRFGDNVIVFDVLRPRFVRAIGEKFLAMLKVSALERRGLTLTFEPSILTYVEKAMTLPANIKNGGRRIRTLLEDRLEKKLNRWVFEQQPAPGSILILGFDSQGVLEVRTP